MYKTLIVFVLAALAQANDFLSEDMVGNSFTAFACMVTHCFMEIGVCMFDSTCRATFMCDSNCDADDMACFFNC